MKRKNVVTIGGGTGSFMLLSGLKKYPVNISAIVSMADDGGSTGILRDELGVLPPGDVRQCLVALSKSSKTLRDLMTYRFEKGGLKGHNFGNLFLSALEKIKGNFSKAVKEAGRILSIQGEVIPVTNQDINLFMKLENGKVLNGENEINHDYTIQRVGIRKNYLKPEARANRRAVESIKEADLVVIGPGNHYCSVLPNFLVKGISEAVKKTKAVVVYNCNLVNKKGHSEDFTLNEYVNSMEGYIGERIDFVTFNSKKPGSKLVEKYRRKKESLVELGETDCKVIKADLLSRKKPKYSKADIIASKRAFIRHDSNKLAKVLMAILKDKTLKK